MNTFDESFLCSTCGEQYAYCGCPNEDSSSSPFPPRTCEECGWDGANVLFHFAGDPVGRCDYCHNNKRASYNTYAEPDWF